MRDGLVVSAVSDLYERVREECPKGLWAQGVKLAGQDRVSGESSSKEEVVLRVRAPGHPVPPTVVLYPADEEWDCDCPSQLDTCAHVAAAVIALKKARAAGDELPRSGHTGASVHYRLRRRGRGLALDRLLVRGDTETRLEGTLYAAIRGPGQGAAIDATNLDLEVDALLGPRPPEFLARIQLPDLFALLASIADRGRVHFEGAPVQPSPEPLRPLALIRDHGKGVRLSVMPHPDITEVVADGVARCGDTLRLLDQVEVTGLRLENLPLIQSYPPERLGELVTGILPELEQQVVLDIRTRRLPGTVSDLEPRIDLELGQDGHSLTVLPRLVYGDPPQARIDDDRLVHLGGLVPIRDRKREQHLIRKLRDELHLVPGRRVTYDGADATSFTDKLRRWRGEVAEKGEVLYRFPLIPRLVIDGDSWELYFETADEEDKQKRRVSAEAVLGAWQGGLGQVPVDGGGWAPLPSDWLGEHGHKVADLIAARAESQRELPLFAAPALATLADELGAPRPAGLDRLAPLLEDMEELPVAKLPADLDATLRAYQKTGVDWLCFLRDVGLGAVLADDMGLGKTLQTICALQGKSLVVCPTSVLHNWAAEIARFRPKLRTTIYHGTRRKLDESADVVLTTYAILRIDNDLFASKNWNVVVLDEAQAIKNPSSQVARAAYRLEADFRVALSGTPVENRLDELWSLLHFTNRGLLGNRSGFQDRYARPIGRGEDGAAERLRTRIRPFVLRRLKRDVAPELPPRTDLVLHVELDTEERGVYDAVRAATRKDVVERLSQGGSVLAALEALLRLRQAACHPALIPGQKAETSAKVQTLVDALETAAADGHKALVFSQWTSLLDLIEPHLIAANVKFCRLDGATTNRREVVATFQDDGGPPVMLASLKAGGTGLNLTAADHVFLCDPWWNPAAEDQAADRAHRIGQERPVMVYRLVSRDTVEERILALQDQKRSLADAALGGADRAAALTREDLLALLD